MEYSEQLSLDNHLQTPERFPAELIVIAILVFLCNRRIQMVHYTPAAILNISSVVENFRKRGYRDLKIQTSSRKTFWLRSELIIARILLDIFPWG